MVTFQFQMDDDAWREWKDTVPRSKSLDARIRELIKADTDGRVIDDSNDPVANQHSAEPAPEDPRSEPVAVVDENVREELREALAGSDDLLEARVDEILRMYHALRDRGAAEKEQLLDVVDVDATRYQDRESVWANMVKGKDTLRALPGVEKPAPGRTEWRYTGE